MTDLVRVADCLRHNALGDGALFRDIHRGRFVYDASAGSWMEWQGHRWDTDVTDRALAAVEDVALAYADLEADLSERSAEAQAAGNTDDARRLQGARKKVEARVDRLRGTRGREDCLRFARTMQTDPLVVRGDVWDQDPDLLVCENGVLDLTTGAMRPGRTDDWNQKAAAVVWDESAACPTWERFLSESIGCPETVAFLQRAMGYGLTGHTHEQVFLLLSGEGRNGKGIFVETALSIMGQYAGPIQAEMLLDQGRGARNPAGPSPDIMSLRGRRLVVASESDEARRFSSSKLKWITGQDSLVGRNPNEKFQVTFLPTHLLILCTNNDPYAPADDFAFWERVRKVVWPFQFVHRPDPDNPRQKLRDDRLRSALANERPGILRWMVEGCLLWRGEGLNPPPPVMSAGDEYRRENDQIQDWIDECVGLSDGGETSSNDLYENFGAWWRKYHGARVPSIAWWGRRMSKKFERIKRGVYYYQGLFLTVETESLK
ncbi:MAG: DNA primase [Deltaproteobacteria bacterium]|nr:DNA primase [Deltaproteobacteria bacterium]